MVQPVNLFLNSMSEYLANNNRLLILTKCKAMIISNKVNDQIILELESVHLGEFCALKFPSFIFKLKKLSFLYYM